MRPARTFHLLLGNNLVANITNFIVFLIAPLAQFVFIPFMATGAGADAIGDWFGRGPERGIALVFTVAGALGVLMTIWAFNSGFYHRLSAAYRSGGEAAATAEA